MTAADRPPVTADLDMLPDGSLILDQGGEFWLRGSDQWWGHTGDQAKHAQQIEASYGIEEVLYVPGEPSWRAAVEYGAGRAETTTATDEDAARVIDALGRHWWSTQTGETEPWDDLTDDEKANVIENAYIDVLATPVLGLLATPRTRPTCGAATNDAGPCVLDPDHITVSAHTGPSGWSWNDDVTMARFGDDDEEADQ